MERSVRRARSSQRRSKKSNDEDYFLDEEDMDFIAEEAKEVSQRMREEAFLRSNGIQEGLTEKQKQGRAIAFSMKQEET